MNTELIEERKYHQNSDADCLLNVAMVLRNIAHKLETNEKLAKELWPTTRTWFKIEADRLLEIKDRWVESRE